MMTRTALALSALLALAACGPDADAPPAELTSAAEVADAMLASFEANIGGVEGFTVSADGVEGRYTVTGDTASMDRVQFQVVPVSGMASPETAQLLYSHVPNVTRIASGMRGAAFEGRTTRDGRPAYVLSTDNPEAMLGQSGGQAPSGERVLRLYVDPETFDVLEIYQSFEADTTAFTTRLIYSDFRSDEGVRLPYRIRQSTTGLNQAIPETERVAIAGQIGLALRQAEQMPMGPERMARQAELEKELRRVTEGIDESEVEIERVVTGIPEVAPVTGPPSGP